MTAILKTEAIALRVSPFARTSHVVTWLAADHGRVVTVVKGACRPKSAFLGQYDVGATCELLFYSRDHEGLHAIRECTALARRTGLHDQWRRATTAGYLCDLVSRVMLPSQEAHGVYTLLESSLDALAAGTPSDTLILRFELALLQRLGVMPQLAPCATCHAADKPWLRFGLAAGRPFCRHAPPGRPDEPTVTVHRGVLDRLQQLAQPGNTAVRDAHAEEAHLSLGLRRFVGIFMSFHLDVPSAPRRLAFEMLEIDPAAFGGTKGKRI